MLKKSKYLSKNIFSKLNELRSKKRNLFFWQKAQSIRYSLVLIKGHILEKQCTFMNKKVRYEQKRSHFSKFRANRRSNPLNSMQIFSFLQYKNTKRNSKKGILCGYNMQSIYIDIGKYSYELNEM